MPYCPIVATLGYVLSPDRRRVLLIHRNARADDPRPFHGVMPYRDGRMLSWKYSR